MDERLQDLYASAADLPPGCGLEGTGDPEECLAGMVYDYVKDGGDIMTLVSGWFRKTKNVPEGALVVGLLALYGLILKEPDISSKASIEISTLLHELVNHESANVRFWAVICITFMQQGKFIPDSAGTAIVLTNRLCVEGDERVADEIRQVLTILPSPSRSLL